MTSLRLLQKTFSLALLDRTRAVPAGIRNAGGSQAERRFSIYRNNVFVSLTEALAVRYPVCRALVGDAFFHAMAGLFVELCPPRSPILMTYGDDFGDFIDTFPPAASIPYLGDMARLEAARTRAYHAADAHPLGIDELASLAPCTWEWARVRLHPSVQVVRSDYPVVSIWEAHLHHESPAALRSSDSEDALVLRPDLTVEVYCLPPGGALFIQGLLREMAFKEAAEGAVAADPHFDLVATLTRLLLSRTIVGLSGAGCQGGGQN